MNKNILQIINYLSENDISAITSLDNDTILTGIGSVENAKPSEIIFYESNYSKELLKKTKAKVCLIQKKNISLLPSNCLSVTVDKPSLCFAHLSNFFYPRILSNGIIEINSNINSNAIIGKNVQIGSFTTIKDNTTIEDGVIIYDNCVIGPNVSISKNSIIYSHNKISNCDIGNESLIQSGCIIGDRGFGFTPDEKIELIHNGNVIIGNNVQIGSNCTIDKALFDSTIICDNVRIDNLVHIAHGVSLGNGTIIAAQTGIAGSTIIGNNCMIGGQVGISGHLVIGNNVIIAAKSGVTKNIRDNSKIAGFPAIDINLWKKIIINQYKKK